MTTARLGRPESSARSSDGKLSKRAAVPSGDSPPSGTRTMKDGNTTDRATGTMMIGRITCQFLRISLQSFRKTRMALLILNRVPLDEFQVGFF